MMIMHDKMWFGRNSKDDGYQDESTPRTTTLFPLTPVVFISRSPGRENESRSAPTRSIATAIVQLPIVIYYKLWSSLFRSGNFGRGPKEERLRRVVVEQNVEPKVCGGLRVLCGLCALPLRVVPALWMTRARGRIRPWNLFKSLVEKVRVKVGQQAT